MKKEQYIILIINKLKGISTPEENRLLETWLKEEDSNQGLMEQVLQDWEVSLKARKPIKIDVEKDLVRFKARMEADRAGLNGAQEIPLKKKNRYWMWAAAAMLLLGGFWWTLGSNNTIQDKMVVTKLGQVGRTLDLIDGTKVWLNENSSISYPEQFNGGLRMVKLEGEAYFDVAKDAEKPFIVKTSQAEIKVLGTAFNLKTTKEDIVVTLDEGRVQFYKLDKSKTLQLEAGETGVLNLKNQTLQKAKQYNRNNSAWQSKMLVFSQMKLTDVLTDVENYFGNKVSLGNPNLKECIFGGNFPKPDVNDVLIAIAAAFDMKLSQDRNGNYLLKGGSCK